MVNKPICIMLFLGNNAKWRYLQMWKGEETNGPAILPDCISSATSCLNTYGNSYADFKFLASRKNRSPRYCNLNPCVKPDIKKLPSCYYILSSNCSTGQLVLEWGFVESGQFLLFWACGFAAPYVFSDI